MESLPDLNIISNTKIELDRDVMFKNFSFFKPVGLWVGLKDSWYNYWYLTEQMDTIEDKYIYKVSLVSDSYTNVKRYRAGKYDKKILIVEDLEDVEYITREYSVKGEDSLFVDWSKFSKRYAGIELRNYNHKFIKNNLWYSTFDASSLCVWDLNLVKSLNLQH